MIRRLVALVVLAVLGGVGAIRTDPARAEPAITLPPTVAIGVRLDTLLLGGYAAGSFADAIERIANDLSIEERAIVALQLERIFGTLLPGGELPGTGRLRLAYERAVRPDDTTRSIRILGAEIAFSGRVHTAYYFEADGRPGYYDPMGRSLDTGAWVQPLEDFRINSPFGDARMHPILNRVLPHTGVDLAGRPGEPVRATADGVVVSAGERGGYGLMVELRHADGYSTRYAHLSGLADEVLERQVVRRGQVIGFVGQSGTATGPHLHYEVRRRGQPVDPIGLSLDRPPSAGAGADPRWPVERGAVGALLARAPPAASRAAGGRAAEGGHRNADDRVRAGGVVSPW